MSRRHHRRNRHGGRNGPARRRARETRAAAAGVDRLIRNLPAMSAALNTFAKVWADALVTGFLRVNASIYRMTMAMRPVSDPADDVGFDVPV